MSVYSLLINAYNSFIAIFPGPLQWLVTLLILVGLVAALIVLIRHHIIFILLAIVLLPFLVPVAARFISDVIHFLRAITGFLHLAALQVVR